MLVRLIAQIASRFGVAVTQKLAAQAVPVIGALGGAAVNYAFIDHFQEVARAHFVVRRLERRYGKEAVRAAYDRLSGNPPAATRMVGRRGHFEWGRRSSLHRSKLRAAWQYGRMRGFSNSPCGLQCDLCRNREAPAENAGRQRSIRKDSFSERFQGRQLLRRQSRGLSAISEVEGHRGQ